MFIKKSELKAIQDSLEELKQNMQKLMQSTKSETEAILKNYYITFRNSTTTNISGYDMHVFDTHLIIYGKDGTTIARYTDFLSVEVEKDNAKK